MSSSLINLQVMLLTLGRAKYDQPNKGQLVRWAPAHSIIRQHFPPPSQSQLSCTSQLPTRVADKIYEPLYAVMLMLSYIATQKRTPLTSDPLSLTGEGHGLTATHGAIDILPRNFAEESLEDASPLKDAHEDAPFENWLSDPLLKPTPSHTNYKERLTRKRPRVSHDEPLRRYKRHRYSVGVSLSHVTYMENTPGARTYAWKRRDGHWKGTPEELLMKDLLSHLSPREKSPSIYVRPEGGDTVRMELHKGEEFIGWDKLGLRKYRVGIEEIKYLLENPGQHIEFTYRLYRM